MGYLDIVIAIVAVLVLARLWAVFGRRNEEDEQRHNPFVTPAAPEEDAPFIAGSAETPQHPPLVTHHAAPASLAGGLEQVREKDPAFDEKKFLQEARATFTAIVEDFAKGDLTRSDRLLAPQVRARFQQALDERSKAAQKMEGRIDRIADAELMAAHAEKDRLLLTVRFVSEQINVLRDAAGNVISGAPDKPEEITDIWTFARDAKSADGWQLVETRS